MSRFSQSKTNGTSYRDFVSGEFAIACDHPITSHPRSDLTSAPGGEGGEPEYLGIQAWQGSQAHHQNPCQHEITAVDSRQVKWWIGAECRPTLPT
jgi:hypothetical protein